MTDANSTQLLIPAEGYVVAAVILFFIGTFGFFLNLAVIVFIWKRRQLWTPLNVILLNLVSGDLLVSIVGNPLTFVSAISRNWILGRTVCIFYGFIMALLGIASITTLTVLAFERYLIIAQPFRNSTLTFRNALYLVTGIWTYSLALTAPPLAGWGEYVTEAANISCSVNWEEKSFNSMTYILYLFAFGLFIPLTVISFSYINIILTIRRNIFRTGRVSRAENRVAVMVFVMIVAFLTAWSPYAVLALIIQFGDASIVTPGIAVIPALLAKSSICYNPIIYIGLNAQFQQTWRRTGERTTSEFLGVSTGETVRKTKRAIDKQKARCKDEYTDVTRV